MMPCVAASPAMDRCQVDVEEDSDGPCCIEHVMSRLLVVKTPSNMPALSPGTFAVRSPQAVAGWALIAVAAALS